jgi:hypothetical protein
MFASHTTAIIVGVALVAYVLIRRLMGEPLEARRLLIMPVAVCGYGWVQLASHPKQADSPLELAPLGISLLISVGLGFWRGRTIRVLVRDGHLWQQYTLTTVAVWILQLGVRGAMISTAQVLGTTLAAGMDSLILGLGLSLLAEAATVGRRALATGAPFAPRASWRSRTRPGHGLRTRTSSNHRVETRNARIEACRVP